MSKEKDLLKNTTLIAFGTLFSRITGLARNLVVVALLGSALLGDTYNVANQMPNIVYNLIIGGSLSAVFIPQIVRALSNDDRDYLSTLLSFITLTMGLFTVISILAAPWLVDVFSASFIGRPEYKITLLFMRLCLPQIFLLTFYALLGQIANAQGKFLAMAWAPVLNNLLLIVGFSIFIHPGKPLDINHISQHQIFWLGLITTLGYVAQAIILIPVIFQNQLRFKFKFGSQSTEIKKSIKLAGWTIVFAAISQLSFLVVQNIATRASVKATLSGIETGVGITPYNTAYLIFILPQSVFVLSLTTTLLPYISKLIHENKINEVNKSVELVFDRAATLVVPCALFLLFFGIQISQILFANLSRPSSRFIGLVLMGFAVGLPAYSYYTLSLRVMNAFENVKLQVKGNLLMNGLGVILCVLAYFVFPAQVITIVLALILSISYFFGMFYTLKQLHKFGIFLAVKNLIKFNYRVLIISFFSILPVWFLYRFGLRDLGGDRVISNLIKLGFSGLVFVALYLYWGDLISLGEIPKLNHALKSRITRKR